MPLVLAIWGQALSCIVEVVGCEAVGECASLLGTLRAQPSARLVNRKANSWPRNESRSAPGWQPGPLTLSS